MAKSKLNLTMREYPTCSFAKIEQCLISPLKRRERRGSGRLAWAAARYWQQYGFANLERARQQRSLNAARRRAERMQREAEQRHNVIFPHGSAFVWYCTCGLTGYGDKAVVSIHREALGFDPPGSSGSSIVRVPTGRLRVGEKD